MKIKITNLKNGGKKIYLLPEKSDFCKYDGKLDFYAPTWLDNLLTDFKTGKIGVLGERYDTSARGDGVLPPVLHDGPIAGNSDHTQKRFHGWRGTTNSCSIHAAGLREVLGIVRCKSLQGEGRAILLSADLAPDQD